MKIYCFGKERIFHQNEDLWEKMPNTYLWDDFVTVKKNVRHQLFILMGWNKYLTLNHPHEYYTPKMVTTLAKKCFIFFTTLTWR